MNTGFTVIVNEVEKRTFEDHKVTLEEEIFAEFAELSHHTDFSGSKESYTIAKADLQIAYEARLNNGSFDANLQDKKKDALIESIIAGRETWDTLIRTIPKPVLRQKTRAEKQRDAKNAERFEKVKYDKLFCGHWNVKSSAIKERFYDDAVAYEYLIAKRWGKTIKCPLCESEKKHYKLVEPGRLPRYKCSSCLRKFSPLVGTIFQNSNLQLTKWFQAIFLLTIPHQNKISSVKFSELIGVHQSRGYYIMKKLQAALSNDLLSSLSVELV